MRFIFSSITFSLVCDKQQQRKRCIRCTAQDYHSTRGGYWAARQNLYESVQKPKELWRGFTDADWSPCTDWDSCDYRESEQIQITSVILSCSPSIMLCVGKCVLLESLDYLKMAQRATSSLATTSLNASVKDRTGLLLSGHHLKTFWSPNTVQTSSDTAAVTERRSLNTLTSVTGIFSMKDPNHHYNHTCLMLRREAAKVAYMVECRTFLVSWRQIDIDTCSCRAPEQLSDPPPPHISHLHCQSLHI